jgi:hypothetical protein
MLLERADSREPAYLADEVATWAPGVLEKLLSAKLLRPAANAGSVVCDACAGDHVEEVGFVEAPPGTGLRGYIWCPESGRVLVPLDRLRCWEVDVGGVAELTAIALEAVGGVEQVVASRVWQLGRTTLAGRPYEVFLCRGSAWADGKEAVGWAARLRTPGRYVVLTLGSIPDHEIWSDDPPPVLSLISLTSWDGQRFLIDRAYIEDSAANWRPKQSPVPTATATVWLTYKDAMVILAVSRTRVADYVKNGDLEHNGLPDKQKRVSAASVALLRLKLEKERLQDKGREVSDKDGVNAGLPMDAIPGRLSLDALAERASKGKNLK